MITALARGEDWSAVAACAMDDTRSRKGDGLHDASVCAICYAQRVRSEVGKVWACHGLGEGSQWEEEECD